MECILCELGVVGLGVVAEVVAGVIEEAGGDQRKPKGSPSAVSIIVIVMSYYLLKAGWTSSGALHWTNLNDGANLLLLTWM